MKHTLFALLLLGTVSTSFARTCEVFTTDRSAEEFVLDKGLKFAQSEEKADMMISFKVGYPRETFEHYDILGDFSHNSYDNITDVRLDVHVRIGNDWKLLTNESKIKRNRVKSYYDQNYYVAEEIQADLLKKAHKKIKKYKCSEKEIAQEEKLNVSDVGREIAVDKSSEASKESKKSSSSKQ